MDKREEHRCCCCLHFAHVLDTGLHKLSSSASAQVMFRQVLSLRTPKPWVILPVCPHSQQCSPNFMFVFLHDIHCLGEVPVIGRRGVGAASAEFPHFPLRTVKGNIFFCSHCKFPKAIAGSRQE